MDGELALDHDHAAFAEILADKLGCLSPCYYVEKIGFLLAGCLALEIVVDGNGEARDRRSVLRAAQFQIARNATYDANSVQHDSSSK